MYKKYVKFFPEAKNVIGDTSTAIQSFTPKNTLNPQLWDENQHLRPEVREDLLKIATDFYDSLDISVPPTDIIMVGSSANYTWSPYSDLDVHIVLDFKAVDENIDLVTNYFNAAKNLWNDNNDIEIRGISVELYLQPINDNLVSSGTYSIMNDQWISEPSPGQFTFSAPEVEAKAKDLMSQIDYIITMPYDQESLNKVRDFKQKLKQLRQAGLESGGEMGTEALAWKTLRRNGYMDKLSEYEQMLKNNIYSII